METYITICETDSQLCLLCDTGNSTQWDNPEGEMRWERRRFKRKGTMGIPRADSC